MRSIYRIILLLAAVILSMALVLAWQLNLFDQSATGETVFNQTLEVDFPTQIAEIGQPTLLATSNFTEGTNDDPTATATKRLMEPDKTSFPTGTSMPTATATRRRTATPKPTPSASPEPTDVVQAAVLQDGIDRTCPDPVPGKPDYRHYFLSGQPWPKPADSPQEHFWLAKPLPGGGRLLYTDWLPYGYDAGGRYLLHNGVDVADPLGTPLLAAADGRVVVAGPDSHALYGWRCDWYGKLVVVEIDDKWLGKPVFLLYGHVLNITVEVGQQVKQGDQVAEVGFGGAAGNPHLHFEVRVGTNEFGSTRNPFLWIRPPATRGLVAGRLIDPQGRPWQGVAIAAVARSEGAETKTSWTYLGDPQGLIKPDEEFAENFVIPDLRPGLYELYLEIQGQIYKTPIEVQGGQMVRAEIITEPFKTPTPEPTIAPQESPIETVTPQD